MSRSRPPSIPLEPSGRHVVAWETPSTSRPAGGEQQRVELQSAAVRGADLAGRVVHLLDGRLVPRRVDVVGDLPKWDLEDSPHPKRLRHRERPKPEVRGGTEDGQLDTRSGEVAKSEERLDTGNPAAGDGDSIRKGTM
jgi:hypothetical protein